MLGLVPVGSAPIGILSLNIRNVANRDLETDGWNPSAGTVIADTLDEDTPDNSDYSYSPNLDDRQTPLVMALNNPLEAGTYTFNFTAQKDLPWGQVKLTLLDSNLTSVGSSSWTGLVDNTFNTYSVTATTTATSAFIKVEARSDAAVVLDFTDQDKTPKGLSIRTGSYFSEFGYNGMYQDKYGYLRKNQINLVDNQTNISYWVASNALSSYTLNQFYSPDNTLNAAKLIESTASGVHSLTSTAINLTTGTTYTRSIYLKAGGRTVCKVEDGQVTAHSAVFSLAGAGTVQTNTNLIKSSIESLTNGWYRCSITFTNLGNSFTTLKLTLQTTTSVSSYSGDGVSGVFFWGNQLEVGWNTTAYTNAPYTEVDHGGGSHRLRIHHDTNYYYVGQEVAPPRNMLAAIPQAGNYTTFTGSSMKAEAVGDELVLTNTGANSYWGIQIERNTTLGLPYSLEVAARKVGSNNVFLRWGGINAGSRTSVGNNTTDISAIAYNTYRSHSSILYLQTYGDGPTGSSHNYRYISMREIRFKPLGLLMEFYTQNELLYSTDLTNNTAWTYNEIVNAPAEVAVDPSGDLKGLYFNASTSTSSHSIQQVVGFTSGSTYIFSVYCTGQVQLRVDDAVGGFYANFLGLSSITPYVSGSTSGLTTIVERQPNGWSRVAIKFVATATGNYPVFFNMITGNGAAKNQSFTNAGANFRLWGPQLQFANIGSSTTKPTSYIPTEGTIVGNPNDWYKYDISSIYDNLPFTLYIETGGFNNTEGFLVSTTVNNTGGTDFYGIEYTATNQVRLTCYLGGANHVLTTPTNSVTPSSTNIIAARFESGNFAAVVNGVLTTSNNTAAVITGIKYLFLGLYTTPNHGGYVRKIRYYNRALSDGELLTLAGSDPDQAAGVNLLTTSW